MKKAPAFHRRLRRCQNFSPHQPKIGEVAKWPSSAMVVGHAPFAPPNVRPWGVTTQKGGGDFGRSVTTFSAPKAPKNGNFWKFLGKIGFSNQFLAKNFEKFRHFRENSPNFVKVEDFIA